MLEYFLKKISCTTLIPTYLFNAEMQKRTSSDTL